jgi:hypothetical protein
VRKPGRLGFVASREKQAYPKGAAFHVKAALFAMAGCHVGTP